MEHHHELVTIHVLPDATVADLKRRIERTDLHGQSVRRRSAGIDAAVPRLRCSSPGQRGVGESQAPALRCWRGPSAPRSGQSRDHAPPRLARLMLHAPVHHRGHDLLDLRIAKI